MAQLIFRTFAWFQHLSLSLDSLGTFIFENLTCLAELRGTPAASRWKDGYNTLAEARASLLDPASQATKGRVWLATISVLHAIDLTAHTGALHHVAACCTHGPAVVTLWHKLSSCPGSTSDPREEDRTWVWGWVSVTWSVPGVSLTGWICSWCYWCERHCWFERWLTHHWHHCLRTYGKHFHCSASGPYRATGNTVLQFDVRDS